MNLSALRHFRKKLAAGEAVYGLWVTLESASIAEMAVALGLDWIVIDAEHGHLDWRDIVAHVRAAVRSNTVVLVRLAELNAGLVKRAMDIGADGVVIPWMETADQVRDAVAFAHYPPEGKRGIGAERATAWGQAMAEHVSQADDNVLVVPIIESVKGGRNAAEMARVPGVEMFFFGPADFSSTAGHAGQWEGPGVAEQIQSAKDAIRAAGKHCGVVATSNANLRERFDQGFRMLALGLDAGLLLRSLHGALESVGRDMKVQADLTPGVATDAKSAKPVSGNKKMDRPPESMRPDRPEVMNPLGSGPVLQIAHGVSFESLVGGHNRSRNLTTGFVTFEPGASLPYHRHPFTESITLIRGDAVVEVEGRRYPLSPMDNAVIPKGVAHYAINPSSREQAVFHIAMASDKPSRELVDRFFSRRGMAKDATGGGDSAPERINRFRLAPRYQAGPNTEFIDFFNENLIPGIEMSGGYGLFHHAGRLPAHIHDFDESICIIEGEAQCIVEGRKYTMSDMATALQPRGRVHYFINETHQPMAMLWVYAGPRPERIEFDDYRATEEGNPWRT